MYTLTLTERELLTIDDALKLMAEKVGRKPNNKEYPMDTWLALKRNVKEARAKVDPEVATIPSNGLFDTHQEVLNIDIDEDARPYLEELYNTFDGDVKFGGPECEKYKEKLKSQGCSSDEILKKVYMLQGLIDDK